MRSALIVVALAGSAIADANPAAEKIYRDGKELLAQGKTAEACDAFRRSNELEARVGTLLNLADCEEKRGRFASAWVAWVDARGLAKRLDDARAALADQRAAAIAPKLSYLTLKIAPTRLPQGVVVRRNGAEVAPAELDVEVPLDPGHFDLEATAPGHLPWKQSVDLTFGQHASLEIPALAVDPNAPVPTKINATGVELPTQLAISSHRIGIGAGLGLSHKGDLLVGGRATVHLAAAGPGTIRAIGSYFFEKLRVGAPYQKATTHAIGLAFEYVHPVGPQFLVAAGLGIGVDVYSDEYNNDSNNGWIAGRVSPTLRLPYSFDLGLHLQVVKTRADTVGMATLGVDYFFW